MLRNVITVLAAGLLMGCAHWDKPGATADDFHAADDACLAAAYQHTRRHCDPSDPNCDSADFSDTPPLARVVDKGVTGREAAYEACMSSKGRTKHDSHGMATAPPIFNLAR